MLVTVTPDHLREGEQQDAKKCPIALAMKECTGREWHVGVDIGEAKTFLLRAGPYNAKVRTLRLPDEPTQFIEAYDDMPEIEIENLDHEGESFSFEIPDFFPSTGEPVKKQPYEETND